MWRGFIPKRAVPKGRPRVTSRGTYMPPKYQAAREEFGWLWKSQMPSNFSGPVELHVGFHTDGVQLVVMELDDAVRPKHVQGDLDNLVGFVLEVMEDIGIVKNDKQVMRIVATCYETPDSKREKARGEQEAR